MKRLICCLDGTWNSDDDGAVPTNVVKIHRAILPEDANGVRQVSHYVKGIASAKDTRAQFLKGAVGYEVGDRIQDGYRFLVDTYEPGDEIFLFGFSRGAFEARSLAGLISLLGIAKKDSGFSVADAWALYRQSPAKRSADRTSSGCARPRTIPYASNASASGIRSATSAIPSSPAGLLGRWSRFHDTRLHPSIEVGLHALSIDEVRGPFRPSLWTRPRHAAPTPGQHVEQVWFAGSHANVGGGFPETELSDIALLWMAERANATAGLALDMDALLRAAKPNALGLQHASATGSLFKWSGRVPFIRLVNQRAQAIPETAPHADRSVAIEQDQARRDHHQRERAPERVRQVRQDRERGDRRDAERDRLSAAQHRGPDRRATETSGGGDEHDGRGSTDTSGNGASTAHEAGDGARNGRRRQGMLRRALVATGQPVPERARQAAQPRSGPRRDRSLPLGPRPQQ